MARQKIKRAPRPEPQRKGAAPSRGRPASGLALWYVENKKWVPLIGLVFGGATLFILMQVETLRNPVAFLGGLAWIVGYLAWGLGRPQDAPARPGRSPVWYPLIALLVLVAVGLCFVYVTTIYRGHPAYATTLAREGAKTTFRLDRPKQTLVVVVHGQFAPDVGQSAEGNYSIALSRGERETTIEGKLQRSTSRTRIRRGVRGASKVEYTFGTHQIASLGAGEYEVEHLGTDETLRRHLRVSIYTTWASRVVLVGGSIVAFLLALLFDVLGSRAGHRTRAATAVASAGAFAEGFRTQAGPDAIVSAVVVGIIASVIAGSVLGWLAEKIAKKVGGEVPAKRPRDDDDDEE